MNPKPEVAPESQAMSDEIEMRHGKIKIRERADGIFLVDWGNIRFSTNLKGMNDLSAAFIAAAPAPAQPAQTLEQKISAKSAAIKAAGLCEWKYACPYCLEGYTPVLSSVSEAMVHPDTPVGRIICEGRNEPTSLSAQPAAEGYRYKIRIDSRAGHRKSIGCDTQEEVSAILNDMSEGEVLVSITGPAQPAIASTPEFAIETEPYIVVPNGDNACAHCNAGTLWDILFVPEDVRLSKSYDLQEEAEDVCEELNRAFESGAASAKPIASTEEQNLWFNKIRPIINAIGEISVQEAMDAVERMLEEKR